VIVLATKDSASCQRAVAKTAELFGDADVIVAPVVPGFSTTTQGDRPGTVRTAIDELARSSAADVLARACEVLGARARPRLLTGDVAPALCALARSERADAIVVGSLASDGVLGAICGSVASQIAHAAPCSVIELGR
jgi:nucleotide-binding universal stress UspA family protein